MALSWLASVPAKFPSSWHSNATITTGKPGLEGMVGTLKEAQGGK